MTGPRWAWLAVLGVTVPMLAMENGFGWAITFTWFGVPRGYQHRVLFFGILGAPVFRGVFIAAGSVIMADAGWPGYRPGPGGIRMLLKVDLSFTSPPRCPWPSPP